MTRQDGPILVIGATGHQGGAVARELLRRNHDVRALTRAPDSPAARRLTEDGATVIEADLDDRASLRSAMADVSGVFSVQAFDPTAGPAGTEREVRQGRAVADVARDVGVPHMVYSSVDGAERGSGIPHFESKWQVEQYLRELKIPATVLRPTAYMDDFTERHGPRLVDGTLVVTRALRPDRNLQMIATPDIGVFAADAFEQPDDHIGRAMALAGDELTGEQIAETFQDATGTPTIFVEQPLEEIRAFSDDLALMLEWFDKAGYEADIPTLRRQHPQLRTLRDWLQESRWRPPTDA